MSLLHRVRLLAQRVGIDVSRYPGFDPTHMLVRLLEAKRVNVVIDVGANSGRYATELRRAGYRHRILSIEPLSGPYSELAELSSGDALWETFRFAIGDEDGTATLNVAANAGESSSILPMLSAHVDAYPLASYVATEDVPLRTLDSLLSDKLRPEDRVFVKADVQGYERAVIAGGAETFGANCLGMQLELSLVPLYEGGMLYQEALEVADRLGFALMGLIPGFTDYRDGRLLQADGIFFRETD